MLPQPGIPKLSACNSYSGIPDQFQPKETVNHQRVQEEEREREKQGKRVSERERNDRKRGTDEGGSPALLLHMTD